jgi:hypothetical protein
MEGLDNRQHQRGGNHDGIVCLSHGREWRNAGGCVTLTSNAVGNQFVTYSTKCDEVIADGLIGNTSITAGPVMHFQIIRRIAESTFVAIESQPGVSLLTPVFDTQIC